MLDDNDDVEPISELYEETAEEEVRRVLRTTGVPAHGASTTGVQVDGIRNVANPDPTPIIVIQANNHDEGVDNDDDDEVLLPEEEENDDVDDESTTCQHWASRRILMRK